MFPEQLPETTFGANANFCRGEFDLSAAFVCVGRRAEG